MKAKKFGFGQAKRLKIHYEREKEDDGTIKDTSYSKINPAKSHLNYNLHKGDLIEELEAKRKTAYIKNEKDAVAFYDIVVPYPKDCSVSPDEYFKTIYDIFTHERNLKHCIGAYVHKDESNPHMHYLCMPIEHCSEFTKSKDVKVYDEKKGREVIRRIKRTFTEKFNANKLFNKKLFSNLHPWLQKQINARGITGTVITQERMQFNKWKEERIEYYNGLIEQFPEKKDEYVDAFWCEYQKMSPKKYKDDRPKDRRLEDYNEMVAQYKMQLEQEYADELLRLEADVKKRIKKKEEEIKIQENILDIKMEQLDELHQNANRQKELAEAEIENAKREYQEAVEQYKAAGYAKRVLANIESGMQAKTIDEKEAMAIIQQENLDDIIRKYRRQETTPNINRLQERLLQYEHDER